MTRNMKFLVGPAAFTLALLLTPTAQADINETLSFEIGEWVEFEAKDGPLTIHRVRVVEGGGGFAAKLQRGDSDFHTSLQLQIEFSNFGDEDRLAYYEVVWVDGRGEVIDGFVGKKNLDEGEAHERVTANTSALKYGLDKARKLKIKIEF